MATVHMICGSTGAGKTTFARTLAADKHSVLFSIDEWMKNLFWMDATESADIDWALPRVQRCEAQIWATTLQLLTMGQDVILDLGFSKGDQRRKFYKLAKEKGHTHTLYFLDVPADERRARVHKRNAGQTGTYEFQVTDDTFNWMESWFQAPADEELQSAKVIKS